MDCSVFSCFRHLYSAGSACVLTIIAWVAHRYGQLYLTARAPAGFLPVVFAHEWSASLWGWNNPFSGVCQSGEAALSTPEAVVASRTDWQTNDVQPTDDQQQQHMRRASFSALTASANSFGILHRAQQHHAHHVSNCRVRQLQFSGIFVALGFVGNGVITVMINSPWQADDDADNQSGDNRGDSAHTSISLTVPPTSLNFAIRLSALCSNWP